MTPPLPNINNDLPQTSKENAFFLKTDASFVFNCFLNKWNNLGKYLYYLVNVLLATNIRLTLGRIICLQIDHKINE